MSWYAPFCNCALKNECVTIDSEVRIMRAKEELPECPVATAVSLIGGKWKLLTLVTTINQLLNKIKDVSI